MADELDILYPSSGSGTPYAIVRRESDGYVWDATNSVFEAWDDASITDYDVALTSQGGNYWTGDFPTGITAAGWYLIDYRVRSGGSPTTGDQQYPGERIYWTGTATASSSSAGTGTGTITLASARDYVRQWLRGESGVAFNAREIDRAMMTQGDDLIRRSRVGVQLSSLTLTANDEALPAFPSGFRPDRFMSAWLIDSSGIPLPQLNVISHVELRERQYQHGTSASRPEYIAFSTHTAGVLYPKPDAAYTMKLEWLPFFDSWTEGIGQVTATVSGGAITAFTISDGGFYATAPTVTFTGGGGSGASVTATLTDNAISGFTIGSGGSGYTTAPTVLLNGVSAATVTITALPDDLTRRLLLYGVPALLQLNMPQEPYTGIAMKEYEKLVLEAAGLYSPKVGSMFARVKARQRSMKRVDFALE